MANIRILQIIKILIAPKIIMYVEIFISIHSKKPKNTNIHIRLMKVKNFNILLKRKNPLI